MMTTAAASSTRSIGKAPTELSEAPGTPVFRLRKSFAAVHFDLTGRGRIVFLPEGAELRVAGASSLCGCLEVAHGNRRYNMFQVDLMGPFSTPIKSTPIKPIRTLAAAEACA
jgi:hypothetical protein